MLRFWDRQGTSEKCLMLGCFFVKQWFWSNAFSPWFCEYSEVVINGESVEIVRFSVTSMNAFLRKVDSMTWSNGLEIVLTYE